MLLQEKPINEIYVSLGSNIEPRFKQLQLAFDCINIQIGTVINSSKIYETPAWGFVSTPFFNACICIATKLSTKETLQRLQQIEKQLGRKIKQGASYEARLIDLDIIYSSEGIFNLPNLIVPHPLMQERKFVLVPLLDIAAKKKHPLLHQTTAALLSQCEDDSKVVVSDFIFNS